MPYELSEANIIGRGGMGCVYKSRDKHGKPVAIKMMSNQVTCYPEYRELFFSEVQTLSMMDHPSVVHIMGEPYQDDKGNMYLPMEFVEGVTLDKYVHEKNSLLAVDEAVSLMAKILEAMQYVHNRGRIHRDIKPQNIMVRPNGNICIIDFGIAKDAKLNSGHTVGRVIGTDGYMSPEQTSGLNIDRRTDIYSLGLVLYYMLTGQHAIRKGANDYETVHAILHNQMKPPSFFVEGIPESIDRVYLKAIDRNMTKRFQSAEDFREALEEADGLVVPKITIGRLEDNDIQFDDEHISKHHLVIKGISKPLTGGGNGYAIEIIDQSTNGTGVDGRFLKHQSHVIDYNGTSRLPDVFLSGFERFKLDWPQVVSLLKERGWMTENNVVVEPPPQPHYSIIKRITNYFRANF